MTYVRPHLAPSRVVRSSFLYHLQSYCSLGRIIELALLLDIMDYFFSTEDMQTSVSFFTQPSDSFVADVDSINSQLEPNLENLYRSVYAEVPFWEDYFIRLGLWCLAIVLNAFVIRHYSKEKGSTRSYILALAFLDLSLSAFQVCASSIQLFVNESLYIYIGMIRYSFSLMVFSHYLYPSPFLALDRFIAVGFPHRVFDISRKVRPVKFVLVILNVLAVTTRLFVELVLRPKSVVLFSIPKLVVFVFAVIIQLFGCLALYTAVIVLLVRSGKTLKHAKHGR